MNPRTGTGLLNGDFGSLDINFEFLGKKLNTGPPSSFEIF